MWLIPCFKFKNYSFSGFKPGVARRTYMKGDSTVLQIRVHPRQSKFFDLLSEHLPCTSTQVRFTQLVSFFAGACNLIYFNCLKIELTKIAG
jgi:hypothetical protein